jgi:uncharacterized membrane protein YgdD (TMEM256/DUF423 family)
MKGRIWIVSGALLAGLSVAAGAYSAHGLKPQVEKKLIEQKRLDDFDSAVRYQMMHAVGLMVVGLVARGQGKSWMLCAAGGLFLAGIVLFCGALYAYAIWDEHDFVRTAPTGGIAFMLGWLALAIGAWRSAPAAAA